MRFGAVPLDKSLGAVLAHSVAVAEGRLRKGKRLDSGDIAQLTAAGLSHVTVAQLDATDLDENTAATRIGQAVLGPYLKASKALAGRVNLVAEHSGIIVIETGLVEAINLIDTGITVATVPQYQRVSAGDLICTVKIIPYAVSEQSVLAVEGCGAKALDLRRPLFETATLIETAQGDACPPGKGRRVLAARLARLGMSLTPGVWTHHKETALCTAMQNEAPGQVILVLTDTATSDAGDVGPQALVDAGGVLTRFGIPVDPGNLLYLGHLNSKPVIGLPGCARSPALNGADWVMERVLCGIDVTSQDMAKMGVGGLLKEPPSRPRPRQA